MRQAIELSLKCPPTANAFSVGAVLIDESGQLISSGYSRDSDPAAHAEESALARTIDGDIRLKKSTLYSTMEPCSERRSRPDTCTDLILRAEIPVVVIASREPDTFVPDCIGVEKLTHAGVLVIELPGFAGSIAAANPLQMPSGSWRD